MTTTGPDADLGDCLCAKMQVFLLLHPFDAHTQRLRGKSLLLISLPLQKHVSVRDSPIGSFSEGSPQKGWVRGFTVAVTQHSAHAM